MNRLDDKLIVHMVEGYDRIGGPPKLVKQIIFGRLCQTYKFHVISYNISGLSLISVLNIRKELLRIKPEVVHIHGLKNDGFHAILASKLAGVPKIILTIHGSTLDSISQYKGPFGIIKRLLIGCILEPLTLLMANRVYCVCDAMKIRSRITFFSGKRLLPTIHNGIDICAIPDLSSSLDYRSRFGLLENDIVFIYTGRIAADKGLFILAEAIKRVFKNTCSDKSSDVFFNRIKFIIVGDGPDFDKLHDNLINEINLGLVKLLGKRDDIDLLLKLSDIFVLPTFHENLSFSLLEAMRTGLPVIASAVGGNVEVVTNNVTGYLVAPRAVSDLFDRIVSLSKNKEDRIKMGMAGKLKVDNFFSVNQVIDKTAEVYLNILKAKK